jgi:adenylate cyclase
MKPKTRHEMFGQSPDEMWKIWLTEGNEAYFRIAPPIPRILTKISYSIFHAIPSDPRCVSCYAPFQGPGAPIMRALGRERSQYSPSLCEGCENQAKKFGARAEVPVTMLFADMRGSTTVAEEMDPREFSSLISKFYSTSTRILGDSGALIDKLIGDEISGYWVPGIAGPEHPRLGYESAMEILKKTGHLDGGDPWIPVGIGVHTGMGVVGAVGKGDGMTDITVLGDTANTAARLASNAKVGEILFSDEIAREANIDTQSMKMRKLKLKGKSKSVDTWTFSSSKVQD